MSKVNLSGVGVGDVLVSTRTLKVTDRKGKFVYLEDVNSGYPFRLIDGKDHGSWKFQIVEKGKRKYKIGDRISGNEVRDHMWKRGTVIRRVSDAFAYDAFYVLLTNGAWKVTVIADYDDYVSSVVEFSDFHYSDHPDFEIVYLP